MMLDVLKIAVGALGSGFILKVVDHVISYRRYATEVRRKEIENDGLVSDHWKTLYDELRKVQLEQARKIEQLIWENRELRQKCEALQSQIDRHRQ